MTVTLSADQLAVEVLGSVNPPGALSPYIQFFDETGINPLPAGILVSLYSEDAAALAGPLPGGVIDPSQAGSGFAPDGTVIVQPLGVVGPGSMGGTRGVINPSIPGGGGIVGPLLVENVIVQNSQTNLGRMWTYPDGICELQLVCGATYTAAFGGSYQAPAKPITFQAAAVSGEITVVNVIGYSSPSFSNEGYALEQTKRLPKGWFSQAARLPGGVAHSIAYAFGAGLAIIDQQSQANLQAMRLQSCDGDEVPNQIDSWSYDMLGPLFQRFPYESNQLYINRVMLMVSRPRCTINAITAIVEAFYRSIAQQRSVLGVGKLGYDITGSVDVSGGYDRNPIGDHTLYPPPDIYVFDWMTDRKFARALGVQAPYFVIQIGKLSSNLQEVLAYDVTGAYDVSGGYDVLPTDQTLPSTSEVAPDPRLGTIINYIAKAGGTIPLYLVGE